MQKSVTTPAPHISHSRAPLPVRLLVAGTGTWTAELLGLASSVVGNEKGTVVGNKGLLQLVLAVLIDVLLVVCDLKINLSVTSVSQSRRMLVLYVRCSWQWLVGWRRSEKCVHHR